MFARNKPVVVWLREDLRASDNPALQAALSLNAPVICIYIFDTRSPGIRAAGGASRWWLHHSLKNLGGTLAEIGGRLDLFDGKAGEIVPALAESTGAQAVFWNRRYGAAEIAVDSGIKSRLAESGLRAASFNAALLVEPWEIRTKSGTEFKVFTPFWRAARERGPFAAPLPAPEALVAAPVPSHGPQPVALDSLLLLPRKPDWAGGLAAEWQPGEAGAAARLAAFLDHGVANYGLDRNRPDLQNVSRLSPHLHFGEISPRQLAQAAQAAELRGEAHPRDIAKFLAEIGWREFSYHLLFHNPELATKNFQPRFDAFPWEELPGEQLLAWQQGRTGYPIVDAGMRELWQTGYMHNRVRMIAASFLIKHLMADWRVGEQWFWDTLCDADPASNAASWQWVAGSGADAAPYFRIFNPVLQGEKFDPAGDYVKKYVPELARLAPNWLHRPWDAPPVVLSEAGVTLGRSYPAPMVDHARARERALSAFAGLGAT